MNQKEKRSPSLKRGGICPYGIIIYPHILSYTMPKGETKSKTIKTPRMDYYTLGYNSYSFFEVLDPEFSAITTIVEEHWQVNKAISVVTAKKVLKRSITRMKTLYANRPPGTSYFEALRRLQEAFLFTERTLDLMVAKGWLRKSGRTVVPVSKASMSKTPVN